MVAANFIEYEKAEAKKRQACGQGGVLLPEQFPEANTGRANDKAAERLGVSGRYVADAVKVKKQGIPELVEKVRNGDMQLCQNTPFPGKRGRHDAVAEQPLENTECPTPT